MIKLVVFDFDGVFTNGKIFYSSNGDQLKYYNVKDGMAINLLKGNNILTALISSHHSDATLHIANHLKFNTMSIGASASKFNILQQWISSYNIDLKEVAYLGDDLVDIECLKHVGLSACPFDAVDDVIKASKYLCTKKGGKGCVREFAEYVIYLNKKSLNPV